MPRRSAPTVRHWLFKTEPEAYSIDDLAAEPDQSTFWDGVRNYQARNFLRDSIQVGDGVLLYHSGTDPLAIVGTAEVVRAGTPDQTAWDPDGGHFDPKSTAESPVWYLVHIRLTERFARPVTREQMQAQPTLGKMVLLQRGSRLSIQPVTPAEWRTVLKMAHSKEPSDP